MCVFIALHTAPSWQGACQPSNVKVVKLGHGCIGSDYGIRLLLQPTNSALRFKMNRRKNIERRGERNREKKRTLVSTTHTATPKAWLQSSKLFLKGESGKSSIHLQVQSWDPKQLQIACLSSLSPSFLGAGLLICFSTPDTTSKALVKKSVIASVKRVGRFTYWLGHERCS